MRCAEIKVVLALAVNKLGLCKEGIGVLVIRKLEYVSRLVICHLEVFGSADGIVVFKISFKYRPGVVNISDERSLGIFIAVHILISEFVHHVKLKSDTYVLSG